MRTVMTEQEFPDYKAFRELSEDELRQKADDVLKGFRLVNSAEANTARLLQAQLYMTELDRRESAKVAERDFNMAKRSYKMEVWVIVLIGLELASALVALWYGVHEGNKQQSVLEHMKQSAAVTATAMGTAANSLQTLTDAQGKSLIRLNEMNEKLQASLATTGTMASTLQTQLGILQKEQAEKLAQLSRKPKLVLWTTGDEGPLEYVKPRIEGDSPVGFGLTLRNQGTATANKIRFRVEILTSSVDLKTIPLFTNQSRGPNDDYILEFPFQRPGMPLPITLTFTFRKNQSPFDVNFFAEADEVEPHSLENNTNLATVRIALGHKSIASTAVYAQPSDESAGKAVLAALASL
jgi:hypothetical protein